MTTARVRTTWAAIGAAVAVSLGAGGIGITHAIGASTAGEEPVLRPIEPCRLADTRDAPHTVGPRSTPLGADETYTLVVQGQVGDCDLTDATALALNVTAIGPTMPTYLTLFPGDAPTVPTASNLNPRPGSPPTPNAVTVDLSPTHELSVYNLQGEVDVIIDVVGFYGDHDHDDRYYTQDEVNHLVGWNKVEFVASAQVDGDTVIASMPYAAAVDGGLLLDYSVVGSLQANETAHCSVGTATLWAAGPGATSMTNAANPGFVALSGTNLLVLKAGDSGTVRLVCDVNGAVGARTFTHVTITASFQASLRAS